MTTGDSRSIVIGTSFNNDDGARLDGVRVLVVDDAPYVLEVATEILERDGGVVAITARRE